MANQPFKVRSRPSQRNIGIAEALYSSKIRLRNTVNALVLLTPAVSAARRWRNDFYRSDNVRRRVSLRVATAYSSAVINPLNHRSVEIIDRGLSSRTSRSRRGLARNSQRGARSFSRQSISTTFRACHIDSKDKGRACCAGFRADHASSSKTER